MQVFKISETVFPGAELQVSLRLSPRGLATFLGTCSDESEPEDVLLEELEPIRRYMSVVASKIPVLIAAGSEVLLLHQIEVLEMQNAEKLEELDLLRKGPSKGQVL